MKCLIAVLLLCAFPTIILAKNPTSGEKQLSPLIKRTLTCLENNRPAAKASCSIEVEGQKVRSADCFEEISKEDKKPRIYCKISCKNGPIGVVVVEKQPNGVRQCVKHFTYNTERRGNEWYLWRSGECMNQTVSFEVGLEDTYCE